MRPAMRAYTRYKSQCIVSEPNKASVKAILCLQNMRFSGHSALCSMPQNNGSKYKSLVPTISVSLNRSTTPIRINIKSHYTITTFITKIMKTS